MALVNKWATFNLIIGAGLHWRGHLFLHGHLNINWKTNSKYN